MYTDQDIANLGARVQQLEQQATLDNKYRYAIITS